MSKLIIKDDFSFVNELIDDHFDYVHDSEENEWTKSFFGEDEDLIRQIVG